MSVVRLMINELEKWGENPPNKELIDERFTYLWNYLPVKDFMKFTNNDSLIEAVGEKLLANPHCPCAIVRSEDTLCPCKTCRETHICHCGIFEEKE